MSPQLYSFAIMAFLDIVSRRPQRLLLVVAVCLIVILVSTYASMSSPKPGKISSHFKSFPKLFGNHSCPPTVSLRPGFAEGASQYNYMGNVKDVYDLGRYATQNNAGNYMPPSFTPAEINKAPRAKAAFISLTRNEELDDMRQSIMEVEYRFNRKFNYPWIFLNDVPFTAEFKQGVRKMTRAPVYFGLVPKEHWSYPSWIDQNKAAAAREKMGQDGIIYGDSESYRHMCRFQSGFFFEHPLTYQLGIEYYWRVEPDIHIWCDIDYDPFVFMQLNNKAYGFTMSLHEYDATIPTLWKETMSFVQQHPEYLPKDNAQRFLTDQDDLQGANYNLCHFWSNFEIGDIRFFRSRQYKDYFNHLDKAGGFFYERWGDAPVHSIAASLFLNRSQLYHFDDIGYYHAPWGHCPTNRKLYHDNGKCTCNPEDSFAREGYSCMPQWWAVSKEGEPE